MRFGFQFEMFGMEARTFDQCNKKTLDTLLLPFIPGEELWNNNIRAILYLVGLIWFFVGVAIVSDIFMSSIERIVSTTRRVKCAVGVGDEAMVVEVDATVWNPTVANLTLMALGSSAPEILLSVIEICGNDFKSGRLGPGTIVGSAAFNLLFITAVCIICVPRGETRRIDVYSVFVITSCFSIFAYLWMLIVLDIITPDEIEIWEAVVTLCCFPLMVYISWWADNRFCLKGRKPRKSLLDQAEEVHKLRNGTLDGGGEPEDGSFGAAEEYNFYVNGQLNHTAVVEYYKSILAVADISNEEAAQLLATKLVESKEHTRLWYRIGACRGLMGGNKLQPVLTDKLQQVYDVINDQQKEETGKRGSLRITETSPDIFQTKAVFEFQAASFAVPESIGTVSVVVIRSGRADVEVKLKVVSIDGTAKAGTDYEAVDQEILFEPFVYERTIPVRIIDDNQWEPDESFFLRLSLADKRQDNATLGQTLSMEITIIDDDLPGTLNFQKRVLLVNESAHEVGVEVDRLAGSDGKVSVKWRTFPDTVAEPIRMPKSVEGSLIFKHGEKRKFITIPLITPKQDKEIHNETFDIEMYEPTGGALIGKLPRISVTISDDANFKTQMGRILDMATINMLEADPGNVSYADQIKSAFSPNGGNLEEANKMDYLMHVITFGWKVPFSFIPPPYMAYGYACFFCSLGVIGILTAVIGDLASIFGCLIGLEATVTAITFVALGTSLPDTFASKTAAVQDKNADNAVGNVTGSNSVNVFLGLGVPWTIASIYHSTKGSKFVVESQTLPFSVLVYTTVALLGLGVLWMRRNFRLLGKAELGGPQGTKYMSAGFLITLWALYIGLSSAQAYGKINFSFRNFIHNQ